MRSGEPLPLPLPLPLPTMLSQALVAFTIEVDGEFEHRMPHRTTRGPAARSATGPWHTSLAMWANFMSYVDAAGTPLRELEPFARMTNLAGLQRWGYIRIEPKPADQRAGPPGSDRLVRPTRSGGKAQQVWRELPALIETRWQDRFGSVEIGRLRAALQSLIAQLDIALPRYLPVVAHELFTRLPHLTGRQPVASASTTPDLSVLLAQVLIAFTLEAERDAPLSLPVSANLLRVLSIAPIRVRDLPRLTGVSKEAVAWSFGVLDKGGYAVAEPDPAASRGKVMRLTPRGLVAQDAALDRIEAVQADWQRRFGAAKVGELEAALASLVGDGTAGSSPLWRGLTPYPDGWRAAVPRPDTLPHHPMVLHRGGFPDGS